ncbi:MAG: DUF4160 domain-containing protein [Rhodospirillales bacterium]|nr:MAG: DUF4160 domain-containing protein [Rhodospirillales bacterium]
MVAPILAIPCDVMADVAMTTVKRFGKLRLAIFPDHNPPHFHILGPDCSVSVDLRHFKTLDGRPLPANAAEILEWAKAHPELLWELWKELNG